MFGRKHKHENEIGMDAFEHLPPEAWELARFWIMPERSFVTVARHESWSPELLGSLLIECAFTAAASYASAGAMSEQEALRRILQGMNDEQDKLGELGNENDDH